MALLEGPGEIIMFLEINPPTQCTHTNWHSKEQEQKLVPKRAAPPASGISRGAEEGGWGGGGVWSSLLSLCRLLHSSGSNWGMAGDGKFTTEVSY